MNNIPSEHQEQKAVINWLRNNNYLAFAIPNGGSRNIIEAKRLKDEGVLAGVPDLFVADNRIKSKGLFIEMKKRTGGRLSVAQKSIIYSLEDRGYDVIVGYGAKDAIEKFKEIVC